MLTDDKLAQMPSQIHRVRNAIQGIRLRSDEIADIALDFSRPLCDSFKGREKDRTIGICLELRNSVAVLKSPAALGMLSSELDEMWERVSRANSAIADRAGENTFVLGFIELIEKHIIDLLKSTPFEIQTMTRRFPEFLVRQGLNTGFSLIARFVKHAESDEKPIKVQIIRARSLKAKPTRPGKRTAFMESQLSIFRAYLEKNPVTRSYSKIIRARDFWHLHQKEYDQAAKNGDGYSDHKTLSRSV